MSTEATAEKPAEKPAAPAKPSVDVKDIAGNVIGQGEGDAIESASYYKKELPQANFAGVKFQPETKFYKANLRGASFEGADLTRCDLQVANLQGANLKGSNLLLANMINADLRGADLSESSFTQARAWGAKWNRQTKFPKGFKPDAPGSRLIYQD